MQREDAVDNFRAGKTWVLIATDVVARGMDFKAVKCVINYDFPDSGAAYIHRIGTFAIIVICFCPEDIVSSFFLHLMA